MRASSLFITCFNDTLFPRTGRAVVELLERLGLQVDFPLEQTCCGRMDFNTGYADETIPLVRRFMGHLPTVSGGVALGIVCGDGARLLRPGG